MIEPRTDYIQLGSTPLDIKFIKFSGKHQRPLDVESSDDSEDDSEDDSDDA